MNITLRNALVAAIIPIILGIISNYIWVKLDKHFDFGETPVDLVGVWAGSFFENDKEIISVIRITNLSKDNMFDGHMFENRGNEKNLKKVSSKIFGKLDDKRIAFTKTQITKEPSPPVFNFTGELISKNQEIKGYWVANSNSGKFSFKKEK